jgi:hypothetical protein
MSGARFAMGGIVFAPDDFNSALLRALRVELNLRLEAHSRRRPVRIVMNGRPDAVQPASHG